MATAVLDFDQWPRSTPRNTDSVRLGEDRAALRGMVPATSAESHSDEAQAGPHVRGRRWRYLPEPTLTVKAFMHEPGEPHTFRCRSVMCGDSHHRRIPSDFLKRALHPRPRLLWV